MTTAVFDTLKASRDLKAAGIEARQAEAIVTTMAGAFEDTVATKSDVVALRADIDKLEASTQSGLAEVKAELKAKATKADLVEVKADMFKVAIGVVIAIILANATMTIALVRFLS